MRRKASRHELPSLRGGAAAGADLLLGRVPAVGCARPQRPGRHGRLARAQERPALPGVRGLAVRSPSRARWCNERCRNTTRTPVMQKTGCRKRPQTHPRVAQRTRERGSWSSTATSGRATARAPLTPTRPTSAGRPPTSLSGRCRRRSSCVEIDLWAPVEGREDRRIGRGGRAARRLRRVRGHARGGGGVGGGSSAPLPALEHASWRSPLRALRKPSPKLPPARLKPSARWGAAPGKQLQLDLDLNEGSADEHRGALRRPAGAG